MSWSKTRIKDLPGLISSISNAGGTAKTISLRNS